MIVKEHGGNDRQVYRSTQEWQICDVAVYEGNGRRAFLLRGVVACLEQTEHGEGAVHSDVSSEAFAREKILGDAAVATAHIEQNRPVGNQPGDLLDLLCRFLALRLLVPR